MNKDGKTNRSVQARRSIDGFVVARPTRPVRRVAARADTAEPKPAIAAASQAYPDSRQAVPEQPVESDHSQVDTYDAPARPESPLRKRRARAMVALRLASAVFALFLLTGGFLVWRGYSNVHRVFRGTETVAALKTETVDPDLLKGEGSGRVNIVLLGVGGPGHDGADLTDTIVVFSVDPVNKTAAMVSVPRDLWVKMPNNFFGAYQKLNAAYESGKYHTIGKVDSSNTNTQALQAGFDAVDTTLEQVLDIPISYHVLVNFQAFKQAVDTVGGVTVNVPTALIDPTMAWENHGNPTLAAAGVQSMDGTKALMYARSRETTSDFARAERQRQILVALKDKVLSAGTLSNPAKIDGLLGAFGNNVYSDLSTNGAMRLMSILKDVGDTNITSVGLSDQPNKLVTTDRVGSASVVRPVAGFNNYSAIQSYVKSKLPDGYLLKERANVAVVGTKTAVSSSLAATLTGLGYTVSSTSTALQPVAGTVVVDLSKGKNPYTKHYLEQRFGVQVATSLPAGITIADPSAAFVIISSK